MRLSPEVLVQYAPPRKVKKRKIKSENPACDLSFSKALAKILVNRSKVSVSAFADGLILTTLSLYLLPRT